MKINNKYTNKQQFGATMPEYALVIALVAVVSIVAWTALGTSVSNLMTNSAAIIAAA